jgi:STE24 endopeptidase
VLAHELGHFKLKHIVKRIAMMFAMSLGFLALLGYLKRSPGSMRAWASTPRWLTGQPTTRWPCCCSCWCCRSSLSCWDR